jgi:hypothetical protein
MTPERIPALDELRESLREAARRDVEAAAPRRRRRRRRRATGALAAVLLGAAAAAGAAELISAGEPVRDDRAQTAAYRPSGRVQIAVQARDRDVVWGAGVYTARNGQRCVLAGEVRGGVELGVVRDGVFHRFDAGRSGACAAPGHGVGQLEPHGDRTLIFGLAKPGGHVTVTVDGERRSPKLGLGGAFLLVYAGQVPSSDVRIDY